MRLAPLLGYVVVEAASLADLPMHARHPGLVRWADVVFYMNRTGSDAVPIVAMICFLMGLILGFQSAVQMHQFGADIFVADLVGLSICMELGPLMVAMICTGLSIPSKRSCLRKVQL